MLVVELHDCKYKFFMMISLTVNNLTEDALDLSTPWHGGCYYNKNNKNKYNAVIMSEHVLS